MNKYSSARTFFLLSAAVLLNGLPTVAQVPAAPAASAGVRSGSPKPASTPDSKLIIMRLFEKQNSRGQQSLREGKYNDALTFFSDAVEEANVLNFADAKMIAALDGVSEAYEGLERYDDALKASQKALDYRQKNASSQPAELARNLANIGRLQASLNKPDDARKTLSQVMQMAQRYHLPDLERECLEQLALVLYDQHDYKSAEETLRRLVTQDALRNSDEQSARHLEMLSQLRARAGNLNEVAKLLDQSVRIRQTIASSNPSSSQKDLYATMRNLSRLQVYTGKLSEANVVVTKLLAWDRMNLTPQSSDFYFDLCTLSMIKAARNEMVAAKELCTDILEYQKKKLKADDPELADTYSTMAKIELAAGNFTAAETNAKTAMSIRALASLPPVYSASDVAVLGGSLAEQGKLDEAKPLLTRAMEMQQTLMPADSVSLSQLRKHLELVERQGIQESGQAPADKRQPAK